MWSVYFSGYSFYGFCISICSSNSVENEWLGYYLSKVYCFLFCIVWILWKLDFGGFYVIVMEYLVKFFELVVWNFFVSIVF